MSIDALLLPLDGVCTAANALHARAWATVLDARGVQVPARRMQAEIGRPEAEILRRATGSGPRRRYGPRIGVRQAEVFRQLVATEGRRLQNGVPDLLQTLRDRGIRTAVVTGLGEETATALAEAAGVDPDESADAFVHAGEDEAAGALPGKVVREALNRLGVEAGEAAAIVSSPHALRRGDALGPVLRLGLTAAAVPDGPFEAKSFRAAGTRRVEASIQILADKADDVLRQLGPQTVSLTSEQLAKWMDEALTAARKGGEAGEIPIGSVVVDGDGTILGRGCNRARETGSYTRHAEIEALEDAAGTDLPDRSGVVLVTTLEPCAMCLGAAVEGGIDAVVYALEAPENGAVGRMRPSRAPAGVLPRFIAEVRREESRRLLAEWQAEHGSGFARRLLARLEGNDAASDAREGAQP
jgi:tRNA(Arg) A34 adenosine deaminase TadA/beta-phosphoglucomutase-like phosphatase (HAD superfamily)